LSPELTEEIARQLNDAANRFNDVLFSHLRTEKGVHVETAIAAAASVAGTLLLRSTGLNLSALQPGQPVLVDTVDEQGMELLRFLQATCQTFGLDPKSGWDQPIPPDLTLLQSPQELARDLLPGFDALMKEVPLGAEWHAYVAGLSAAKIVAMGAKTLAPDVGKAVLLNVLVAASKTVPLA